MLLLGRDEQVLVSLPFGRGSRVEGKWSRVEGEWSRVEGNKSRVENFFTIIFECRQMKISYSPVLLELRVSVNIHHYSPPLR